MGSTRFGTGGKCPTAQCGKSTGYREGSKNAQLTVSLIDRDTVAGDGREPRPGKEGTLLSGDM